MFEKFMEKFNKREEEELEFKSFEEVEKKEAKEPAAEPKQEEKGGVELKRIGSYARADLEKMLGTKVYLNLWVKVKENWRESAKAVTNFGYNNED